MRCLAIGACLLTVAAVVADPYPAITPWASWPTRQVAADPPITETITLREVWRLDCGEDAEPLIGRITSAAPGLDGRVLLIDSQMAHVLVVAGDGSIERVAGKRGPGPGEVSSIYRATALADGRLGMVAGTRAPTLILGGRGDLVLLDQADDPAGAWQVAGDPGTIPVSMVRELRSAPTEILVASMRTVVSEGLFINLRDLALVTAPHGERRLIARQVFQDRLGSGNVHERDAFEPFADGRCDLHANGRVALAPERDHWLVCVREPDGSGFNLERPWPEVKRSEAQIAAAMEWHGVDRGDVLDHEPAVGRVRWRPDGRLWVEPGGVVPAQGSLACFDELSSAGDSLRRVNIAVPGTGEGDQLVVMEDGRFVLLRGFGSGAAESPTVLLLEH